MHEDELNKQRQPAIWLRRAMDTKGSLSKLGGRPELPLDIVWPRHGQSGAPLHFLAQIDLSSLPHTPLNKTTKGPALPKQGYLFFFGDMVEEMLWGDNGGPFATTRVVYAAQAGAERVPPDDTPEILHGYGEKAGGFKTGIIEYPQMALEPHVIDTFSSVAPSPDESAAYTDASMAAMIASIEKAIGPMPVFDGPDSWKAIAAAKPREFIRETPFGPEFKCPMHQMLGFATNIQGTAEELQSAGTILLLQLDSDLWLHNDFMFCDMGAAQFWIEPADLAKGKFEKAWATTEGG